MHVCVRWKTHTSYDRKRHLYGWPGRTFLVMILFMVYWFYYQRECLEGLWQNKSYSLINVATANWSFSIKRDIYHKWGKKRDGTRDCYFKPFNFIDSLCPLPPLLSLNKWHWFTVFILSKYRRAVDATQSAVIYNWSVVRGSISLKTNYGTSIW